VLSVRDLEMEYRLAAGVHQAVKGVSFEVEEGEFFTLLGPSGCGKTTTLRSIAGLETPTAGRITIDGAAVFDAADGTLVPPNRRDISMVFQSYAIWPHMSVLENVAFPLEAGRVPSAQRRQRAEAALAMVGLADYAGRPATQLSGGQQQRVALARAIVKDAKVLLLDEPLSNLDAKLREQMRAELRDLQHRLRTTTIYVTHDQEEALSLSDRIALMDGGRIVELSTPRELYLRPRHAFTARFLGQAELLDCSGVSGADAGFVWAQTGLGPLLAASRPDMPRPRLMMIRPEHIEIAPSGGRPNCLRGSIASAVFSGKQVEYQVQVEGVDGPPLPVQSSSREMHDVGEGVVLYLPPERCVLLED